MGFFKRLFETKHLTLRELIALHEKDGLYKGEILNELKNVVLFIGLPEGSSDHVNLTDPTQGILFIPTWDNRGFFLPTFVDRASLKQRSESSIPHMADFKTTMKIVENPYCVGLVLYCGDQEILFTRDQLSRIMPSVK